MYIQKTKDLMLKALKEKDKEKASSLRLLLANLENLKISKGEITEDGYIGAVKKELKKAEEELSFVEQDSEKATKVKNEITLLKSLIPEQLSGKELEDKVIALLDEISQKEEISKRHMGVLKKELPTADLKEVSKILSNYMSK